MAVLDRYVADRPRDSLPVVGQPARSGFNRVASTIRQQDGGACLGQAAGGGEAETLCGPGDHGDAALEIEQVGDRPVRIGVWRRPCRHRR